MHDLWVTRHFTCNILGQFPLAHVVHWIRLQRVTCDPLRRIMPCRGSGAWLIALGERLQSNKRQQLKRSIKVAERGWWWERKDVDHAADSRAGALPELVWRRRECRGFGTFPRWFEYSYHCFWAGRCTSSWSSRPPLLGSPEATCTAPALRYTDTMYLQGCRAARLNRTRAVARDQRDKCMNVY